jgi:hypothetical protein
MTIQNIRMLISININFNFFILCLKKDIAKIPPIKPPKKEIVCKFFSLILCFDFIALYLSKPKIRKLSVFIIRK